MLHRPDSKAKVTSWKAVELPFVGKWHRQVHTGCLERRNSQQILLFKAQGSSRCSDPPCQELHLQDLTPVIRTLQVGLRIQVDSRKLRHREKGISLSRNP